ncbi:MAG: hypothetical protein MNPFHGCM_00583 [Gemmatimonadaceae bacterium]|nr:hypothetical protein [Gemmatimonadaceae bacterium]
MAILFGSVLPKRRRARARTGQVELIPFGTPNAAIPPRPILQRQAAPTPPMSPRVVEQPPLQNTGVLVSEAQMAVAQPAPPLPMRTEYPPLRLEVGGGIDAGIAVPDFRSSTLRVQPTPMLDGTLQFLPGRFEIIEGSDSGQEVRFVKTPGPDGTSITFGRSDGPTYRHVTLNAATVSRQHARIVQEGRDWRLFNLSKTNPVVINGRAMDGEGDSSLLNDGDRVEMGEVVFRYHAH